MKLLGHLGLLSIVTLVGCTAGPKGDSGPQGANGATGPQGEQGEPGSKGEVVLVGFADSGTVSFDGGVVIVSQPRRGLVLRQGDGGVLGSPNGSQVWMAGANCYAYVDLRRNELTGFGIVQFESNDCTGTPYGNLDNPLNCRGLANINEPIGSNRFFAPVQPIQPVSMARGSWLTNGQVCASGASTAALAVLLVELPTPRFSPPLWVAEE